MEFARLRAEAEQYVKDMEESALWYLEHYSLRMPLKCIRIQRRVRHVRRMLRIARAYERLNEHAPELWLVADAAHMYQAIAQYHWMYPTKRLRSEEERIRLIKNTRSLSVAT
jgi:hypothetical protein